MRPVHIHLPPGPMPVAHCESLATQLGNALARMRGFGLRLGEASRLPKATVTLRHVARRNRYPCDEVEQIRVGNAISAAYDICQIMEYVSDDPTPGVLEDLRRCAKGSLDDVAANPSRRAQGQLHLGAVLSAGGLVLGFPEPGHGKSPDFTFTVDGLQCGLEIKQPKSMRSLTRNIDAAVGQLEAWGSRYHVLVVECSDLAYFGKRAMTHRIPTAEHDVFGDTIDVASKHIRSQVNQRVAGFDRVMVLLFIAKAFLWTPSPGCEPNPVFGSALELFRGACHGLVLDQSVRISNRIVRGMSELGSEVATVLR